jgi:hypothetical protein
MNIVTDKVLPRRTVLKGLGAGLALPLLEAMQPMLRAAAAPAKRFMGYYVPNGMAMPYWSLKGTDVRKFDLSPILEPLAPFREQTIVLSGIRSSWSQIHAGASTGFLTGCTHGGRGEIEIVAGISIDQILGKHFAGETQVGSLEMALDLPAHAGACTGNLSCQYTHTISWRSETQPLPMEWNPRTVFERLFGDSGSTHQAARLARMREQKSVLDAVNDKLNALKRSLGVPDQRKLAEYSDAVRDVERRIQRAEEQSDLELPEMDQPQGAPREFADHLALMQDMQLLAFQSDLTRVITFMLGKEQSARPYPQIGVPEAHHPLSHHNDSPDLVEKMSRINRYHVELFAKFLAKLRATPDGDGTLLDNTMILYGSGISNSTRHAPENLPLMLVGGGGGTLNGGRHLSYAGEPSMANLLVTLMDKMGLPMETVGGSTGKLPLDPLAV